MSASPLVSIICVCYNHEKFLEEALLSVVNQDYPNKEIYIVDDCSNDNSVALIQEFIKKYPEIKFIKNEINIGNCKSFNSGFEKSKGEYIIDFSTDDIMLPGKIRKQVEKFSSLPEKYGVIYSDAEIIDEKGNFLGYHHKATKRASFHPEGDIFKYVVWKYFICPPTMMIRRIVLEDTGGYDTSLAYEDFNFWILSARNFYYAFISEPLVKRRVVHNSLSMSFYINHRPEVFQTTLKVLEKAYLLCKKEDELKRLTDRIKFELKHSVMMEIAAVPIGYKNLLLKLKAYDWVSRFFLFISVNKIPVTKLYTILLRYKGVFKKR
jgi:glycosyltransferase involved in cell wall biosynthesis